MIKCRVLVAAALLAFAGGASAVEINKADAKTIAKDLIGVGPALAAGIVAEREAHGPFKDSSDLDKRVKGVGPKIIEKNKDHLTY